MGVLNISRITSCNKYPSFFSFFFEPALDRIEKFSLGDCLKHLSARPWDMRQRNIAAKFHADPRNHLVWKCIMYSPLYSGNFRILNWMVQAGLFFNGRYLQSIGSWKGHWAVGKKNNETVMVDLLLPFETSTSWCSVTCRLRGVLLQQEQSSPNVH